jgi:type IV pilus assembly protein PilB
MADPSNLSALDDVAFRTGLKVVPVIAPPSVLRKAIDRAYGGTDHMLATALTDAEAEARRLTTAADRDRSMNPVELRSSADQLPVVRLVHTVLAEAVRRGASDIHMEPGEEAFQVRFRIDGVLQDVMTPPRELEPAIVSRLKIMASLDISERRLPQDGRIKFRDEAREIDFRVSVLPAMFGESVVLRILDKSALKLDLTQLGFDFWALEHFQKAVRNPYGMILITGPTGSGKTTTLYSALQTVNTPGIHILTLEDPVEYNLKRVNQIQVNEEIGLTFAAALRSVLRHDPDIVLVGEMRDIETATIAVRAALTGHLVLSTLHTNDCASTIGRLLDMGVAPFLLSSSLRLIAAQRLVRKVCVQCKEPYEADEDILVPYGHTPQGLGRWTFYKARGCEACNFTGMKGRLAIYEVMPISKEIRELIMHHGENAAEICKVARDQGMRTLREAGLTKVIEGVSTVDEVLRVTAE